MLRTLFSSRRQERKLGDLRPREGTRVYAVGDVHGRSDLLDKLLAAIEADAATSSAEAVELVFLGDLIDRGPDSAGVLHRLSQPLPFASCVFLMGNHEELALRAYDGQAGVIPRWLRYGGAEFMQSYGMSMVAVAGLSERELIDQLRKSVPPEHIAFLRSFRDVHRSGDYVFVHAGVRPGRPLAEQKSGDLRWIRSEFLADTRKHEGHIVHGHSMTAAVDAQPNRIGIDTGAYRTGVLTALVLEGTHCSILQTDESLGVQSSKC
jgi:serine/threonine protein phosphatase 1